MLKFTVQSPDERLKSATKESLLGAVYPAVPLSHLELLLAPGGQECRSVQGSPQEPENRVTQGHHEIHERPENPVGWTVEGKSIEVCINDWKILETHEGDRGKMQSKEEEEIKQWRTM